jgi:hypothetical protein
VCSAVDNSTACAERCEVETHLSCSSFSFEEATKRCCFEDIINKRNISQYSKIEEAAHHRLLVTAAASHSVCQTHDGGAHHAAHSHSAFKLGEVLQYVDVAGTMLFIIVFTIFCEKFLARTKRWISYFNPLLHPCVDKVVSELMILGATAFGLTVVNETHPISGYHWYMTLHWIDTTIFMFAVIYVMCTIWVLTLMKHLMKKIAVIDAIPAGDLIDKSEHWSNAFTGGLISLEHDATDFVERVRGELKAHAAAGHNSNVLPPTVINMEHVLCPVEGQPKAGIHDAVHQIRTFVTSEAKYVVLQFEDPDFHEASWKMVEVRPFLSCDSFHSLRNY